MLSTDTLLLSRRDVAAFLSIEECIIAVEQAFKLYAEGKAAIPKVLGIHAAKGGFHIKAGMMNLGRNFFVAKSNANFPQNPKDYGLPSIQGIIIVGDGENGRLLALLDSIEITILRTGAATGVAAKYLSKPDARVATIIGCGNQGAVSLRALKIVRPIEKAFVFDIDPAKANHLAEELSSELKITIETVSDVAASLQQSDICVTCTSSKKPFLKPEYIKAGTFIAAVGADSEDKQELYPELLASNKVVTDMTDQCVSIGELHHAIDNELMIRFEVHAELGEVIAGQKPGRISDDEIIIFDSTGTALQDIAASVIVYEKAMANNTGVKMNFSDLKINNISEALKNSERDVRALRYWFPFKQIF